MTNEIRDSAEASDESVLLQLYGIGKSFPGVRALDDVSFEVRRGSVHALVGENGAGKSTLIKILGGIYTDYDGVMELDGVPYSPNSPGEAQDRGVAVVHQEIRLVETLTVAENIFLGHPSTKSGIIDWRTMNKRSTEMIERLGLTIDPTETVADLPVAKKQIVEICKAMNRNAQLLIMDEPSATLTDRELDVLFDIVRRLQSEGVSILYISHKLEEIFQICDEITVLRDGKHITTTDVANVTKQTLINLMVGRELGDLFPKEFVDIGGEVLRVEGMTRPGEFEDVSFRLREGEILGVAGLVGSGRTETMRGLLGIDRISQGNIWLHGKPISNQSFRQAIHHGFALVPEDRKLQGLIQIFSVAFNISLVNFKAVFRRGILSVRRERKVAEEQVRKLSIKTPSIETIVENLSGGNQQKVVVGKWLLADAEIIIMDEPTRGIDVGAKAELYRVMNDLVRQRKSIIMISSELPEIIGMSDRVIVMREGRVAGEIDNRNELTQENIMSMAFGS